MNDKLKRAVAIIALVFVLVFTVSLILYLFDKTMLNGAIGDLALWSGAFGGLLALVLWLSHAFPSQQRKDEERERLYRQAEQDDETMDNSEDEEPDDEQADPDEVRGENCPTSSEKEANGENSENEEQFSDRK